MLGHQVLFTESQSLPGGKGTDPAPHTGTSQTHLQLLGIQSLLEPSKAEAPIIDGETLILNLPP